MPDFIAHRWLLAEGKELTVPTTDSGLNNPDISGRSDMKSRKYYFLSAPEEK